MPGEAWWQPVLCPVHQGPMRHNLVMSRWECGGWDGEGCDQQVTDEDMDRGWVPVGTADPAVVTFGDAWPDDEPVTPWADPWHDVAGDLAAVREQHQWRRRREGG